MMDEIKKYPKLGILQGSEIKMRMAYEIETVSLASLESKDPSACHYFYCGTPLHIIITPSHSRNVKR